jgi:tetratricopeptide (TPR) repeat protein
MRNSHLLCAALLCCSLAPGTALAQSPPSPAAAESESPKQEAARRFEHAIKLYEEGDYALALAEFERVYELVPDYRVLYNIGQVNLQLGRYARALRTLREYVSRGGSELPAERRSAVQTELESLAARTASIELEVSPAGAELFIDGTVVGKSPLTEPIVVDVGERTVQARLSGHFPRAQTLTLAGGDRRRVALTLEPDVAPLPAPLPAATAPQPTGSAQRPEGASPAREAKSSWLWLGWSATGALAVSSGVSMLLGASAASELHALSDSRDTTRADLDQARSRAKTRLVVADILGVAALATGATTLYFQLSRSLQSERRSTPAQLGLRVSPNGIAVLLEN